MKSSNIGAWEYVKDQAYTNGIESFWALLKRGYIGTYHKMGVKHLNRYAKEFADRHNQPQTHPTCLLYTSPSPRDS